MALRLNPGLAFGTGSHATTRLCLTELEKYVRRGIKMLDLGCGSGILSIAALLLGAESAMACDVDEKAVDIAYENAALNGIDPANYAVWAGDILSDKTLADRLAATGPYPIVLANIVSDVIIPLSAFAGRFAAPGGKFLCSGIIDTRADEVEAALKKNGLKILERIERDGWCALCAEVAG